MNFQLMAAGDDPLSHVVQHPLKKLHIDGIEELFGKLAPGGELTVLSDQIVTMIVAALLLGLFFPVFVRKRRDASEVGRLVPSGWGNLLEAICNYLREEVARPALGKHTDRFVKYIWTVFFFILTMNLLGMIPFASVFALAGLHLGGTPTANIFVTSTLAVLTLVMMVVNGLRLGGKAYLAHFNPGPAIMAPLMVPLEIISTLARIFALAMRLFAAIAGGHILLAVLVGLILSAGQALGTGGGLGLGLLVVVGSVGISLVEVFVAFLQAFIFTYLTSLFIGMSVNVHHDDAHAEGAAH